MERMETVPSKEEAEERAREDADFIRWFDQLGRQDVPLAGGKGANLGELVHAGAPVPPGFVITSQAFDSFLASAGIKSRVFDRLAKLDVDSTEELRAAEDELKSTVVAGDMPAQMKDAICGSYARLAEEMKERDPFVAVRSSATAEDTAETSFAGMNETFLNVKGPDQLIESVKKCWASLYGSRVIFYRRKQNIPEERMSIAVIIQAMVEAEKAGVLFTVNPATGDPNAIVIESSFGLGDAVVSGAVKNRTIMR